MTGNAENFLKYNEDNVMMQLLALEDHFRLLSSDYKSEHAACCTKHILFLLEEAREGQSHASEVGDSKKVRIFKEIDEDTQKVRVDIESHVPPEEIIRKVRAIRRKVEGLNPNFNLEKCEACSIKPVVIVKEMLANPNDDQDIFKEVIKIRSEVDRRSNVAFTVLAAGIIFTGIVYWATKNA